MRMESMTSGFADWLARIQDEQRTVGEHVEPPASEHEIAALAALTQAEFGAALPEAYAAFLRRADGLDFNGTALYATRERQREGMLLFGLPEQNRGFRAGQDRRHLLLGETGDELFAQDVAAGHFVMLDRGSLSEIERFADGEALLARVLQRAFES